MPEIHLQPRQGDLLDLIEHSQSTVIGVGGGRGAAKSGGADRIALILMTEQPGTVACIVMRNYDQVRKYHIEPMTRDYPEVEPFLLKTDAKLKLPVGKVFSELDFSYAESLEDVKRRFRSGNYRYIFVDQAEQFTWDELSEMMLANRARGGQKAVTVLLFNMGGAGIQALRDRFGPVKKFNANERPEDYAFLHVYPWDNVEWSRTELAGDGLSEDDYYGWADEQRKEYFVTRSAYGRKLNALDDATRARDLLGSWESLEGAFFGRVFDLKAVMQAAETAEGIIRPWDARWMSTDWGKTHYCSTHWHAKTLMTPREVRERLGWDVPAPLNVVSTYRRMIVNEQTSTQVGKGLVAKTPVREREQLEHYFLSPDAFGERDSDNTTADLLGTELKPYGMPEPSRADDSRKVGWGLMYALLNNTRIWATPPEKRTAEMTQQAGDTVWIISTECPEILDAIPLAMRNVKDLDDVVKSDKSKTDINADVLDDCRYGLQSMLGAGIKPEKVKHAERLMDLHGRSGYSQELTMAEMAFRAQQNGPQFSVTRRRR
jgi:hypothetical protein